MDVYKEHADSLLDSQLYPSEQPPLARKDKMYKTIEVLDFEGCE